MGASLGVDISCTITGHCAFDLVSRIIVSGAYRHII